MKATSVTPDERAEIYWRELKSQWESLGQERREVQRRIDRARGANLAPLMTQSGRMQDEPGWHQRAKPNIAPNVIGDALNILSYLYNNEPVRIMSDRAEDEWAREVLWDYGVGLSTLLDMGDWYVRLLGQCLAYLQYTPDGICVSVLTPDRYVFSVSPDNPDIIASAMVLVARYRDDNTVIERYHYTDDAVVAVIERHVQVSGISRTTYGADWRVLEIEGQPYNAHGYGMPPVVLLPNEITPAGYAPCGLGGSDLLDHALQISRLNTEYAQTAMLSRGQPWEVEAPRESPGPDVLAPDVIKKVGVPGGFGIAPSGGDLAGMRDALMSELALFAVSIGLPPDTWRVDVPSIETGSAIIARRVRITEDRKKRARLASRMWEMPLHRVAAAIWNAHTGTSVVGELESVEYVIASPMLTHSEQLAQATFELDRGLASRREIKRALYPSLSPDEIDLRLDDAQDDAATLTPAAVTAGRMPEITATEVEIEEGEQ